MLQAHEFVFSHKELPHKVHIDTLGWVYSKVQDHINSHDRESLLVKNKPNVGPKEVTLRYGSELYVKNKTLT